jgi:hypothetical protein
MTTYNQSVYNSFTYGDTSRLTKSVGNFTAVALNYSKVTVSWSNVVNTGSGYTAFRIVRSQEGYSETSEDGIILYEEFGINATSGSASKSTITDYNTKSSIISGTETITSAPVFLAGKPVYYSAWWLVGNVWSPIGYTYLVLPKQHYTALPNSRFTINTHEKIMNLLPRIYTSKSNSPLDEIAAPEYDINGSLVAQGSDLYFYLKGLSVSADEILTYIDYLVPDFSGRHTIPSLVFRQAYERNFTNNNGLSIQRQKDLVKNAIFIYSRKGTYLGLTQFIKSFTGLTTYIKPTPNTLLTLDDSSFKLTIGKWSGGSITRVSYSSISLTPPAEPYAIETTYCSQITGSATVANGVSSPITNGTPVIAGKNYYFTFYARKSTTTGTALPRIKWFDYTGTLISSSVASSTTTVQSTSWTKVSYTGRAPGANIGIVYAGLVSNVVTLGLNSTHNFVVGDSVIISGVGSPFDGTKTITTITDYSVSYSVTNANIKLFEVNPNTNAAVTDTSTASAVYAGLEIDFGTGTYYLNFVQLSATNETYYYEPRGVNVFLYPRKTNYITNPSFEADATGWTIAPTGSVQTVTSSPKVLAGSKVYQVTTSSSSQFNGYFTLDKNKLATGKNYVFSIWAKTNNSSPLTYTVSLSAKNNLTIFSRTIVSGVATITLSNTEALSIGDTIVVSGMATDYNGTFTITDVEGANVSYSVPGKSDEVWTKVTTTNSYATKTITNSVDVTLTNSWTRPEVNLFIPYSWITSDTNVICQITSKANAGGEIVYLDAAQLEEGVYATDYFDGSYPWQFGSNWATANNSISYLYPNKANMINALSQELVNFLPYETPWYVNTVNTIEAKGITQ